MYPWYWRLIRIFPLINKNKIDSIYIAVPWIKLTLIDLACRVLFRQSRKQSRPCRGPFLEGPEKFSHSKISNLIVTELFCSIFLLVIWTEVPFIPEGSRSFRRIHFSVFRYSWIKNGIIGVCLVGGSSEGSPLPWREGNYFCFELSGGSKNRWLKKLHCMYLKCISSVNHVLSWNRPETFWYF